MRHLSYLLGFAETPQKNFPALSVTNFMRATFMSASNIETPPTTSWPSHAGNFVSASDTATPPTSLFSVHICGQLCVSQDTTTPPTDVDNPCCDMQETFWQPIASTKGSDPFGLLGYVSQEFRRFDLHGVGIRPARSRLSKFLKFSISFNCARIPPLLDHTNSKRTTANHPTFSATTFDMDPPKRAAREAWERNFKGRQYTADEWNEQFETFKQLYVIQDLKLSEVRRTMAYKHNFYAT